MSALSLVTSVPFMPMPMPMSAFLMAGASLTPSPVMATTSPCACRASTMRSLCSGLVRAYMSTFLTASSSSSWLIDSISSPVSTVGLLVSPISVAMACAVIGLSPVTIFTCMPACAHSLMAWATSSLGGSMSPSSPMMMSSCSVFSSVNGACTSCLYATASTRSAFSANAWFCARSSSLCFSVSSCSSPLMSIFVLLLRSTSGAPLINALWPLLVLCMVVIIFLSEVKMSSSSLGRCSLSSSSSMPAFLASTASAPSVGSPCIPYSPSSWVSCALLHSTAASRSLCRVGLSFTLMGFPSWVMFPSGW